MTVKTSAPGNVFFFGEHSVVYEKPAILAAINQRTYCELRGREDRRIKISSEEYGEINSTTQEISEEEFNSHEDYEDNMDPLRNLVSKIIGFNDVKKGFSMNISSEIPKESGGMSSSTAVLSSVLKALSENYKLSIEKEKYFEFLYPLQVKIHGGSASGSEITSSSLGGYNKFLINKSDKGNNFKFNNLGRHSYELVIGNTGIESNTNETVPYVRKGWEKDKESYEDVFSSITSIVKRGEEALMNGDTEKVGRLMNQNQEYLKQLGVSHPKLEKMIETALEKGAYGAKLSGGGKGGIMIALCPEDKVEEISSDIEEEGKKSIVTEVGVEGARIE